MEESDQPRVLRENRAGYLLSVLSVRWCLDRSFLFVVDGGNGTFALIGESEQCLEIG